MLEYFVSAGQSHATDRNPAGGKVWRTKHFDKRDRDGTLHYTSRIADARKAA